MTEVLAVIPARGGSKGIPRKNLTEIDGRTLVARAVAAARDATTVTRIIGSTDDEEIADEMRRAGAEVPWLRPAELSGDDVPDSPVFLHVLEMLLESERYRPEIVVNVRPTAPLRSGADIDAAVRALLAHPEAASVKSVSLVTEHPYKMWLRDDAGILHPLLPEWHLRHDGDPDAPRQSLTEVWRSNGAVDAVRAGELLASGRFHPGVIVSLPMDAMKAFDIDTIEDLELVRAYQKG